MSDRGFENLKKYRSVPVPWVARWSGEVKWPELKASLVEDGQESWPLMEYRNFPNERDEHGILWQNDGQDRSGEPQFGQVNTLRQVECIRKRLCQVCGNRIMTKKTPFLLGSIERKSIIMMAFMTTTPPVCLQCVEHARRLCPDLNKGNALLMVTKYEPVAVYGQVFMLDPETKKLSDMGNTDMALGHPGIRSVYGKQLVVKLTV